MQVNGYAGVDFNSKQLAVEDLHEACKRLRADGVGQILATVITDAPEYMVIKLANIAKAVETDSLVREVIRGIHIEGPFLNPADGCIGAHPVRFVCPPDKVLMQRLLESASGLTRLVTLAPEIDGACGLTRSLVDSGITVSAGHCDSTRDELLAAIDSGLSMFTHVGNGCSLMLDRHDNIIQRVLSLSDKIWCCFIADGIHVPGFALANYLNVAGVDRSIVVSDAMSAAGLGPGNYKLGDINVSVDEQNRAELAGGDGRLAGSVATLPLLLEVLRDEIGLTASEIESLLFRNPVAAIT